MKTRKFVLISGLILVFVMALAGYETAIGSTVAAGSMPHSVAVDPTGKYVYVANFGSDNVSMYRIGADGALIAIGSPVAAEKGSNSVAVDPTGKYVYVANGGKGYAYVANGGGSNVSMYRIGADGALTAIGSPVAAEGLTFSVAVDPTGKYVYVANSGSSSNNVSMYRIGANGVLTDVNTQAAGRQYTATSPSSPPPQAAAADWKQYFKQPYATFYYDANSIQRSGDVVQVTTLQKFTWLEAGVDSNDSKSLFSKIDHSIELLEINCRSKATTSKRNTIYKPDGSVLRDDRFTESDKDGKPKPINPVFGEDLLYHIVCGM